MADSNRPGAKFYHNRQGFGFIVMLLPIGKLLHKKVNNLLKKSDLTSNGLCMGILDAVRDFMAYHHPNLKATLDYSLACIAQKQEDLGSDTVRLSEASRLSLLQKSRKRDHVLLVPKPILLTDSTH